MLTSKDKKINDRIEHFMIYAFGLVFAILIIYKIACLILNCYFYQIAYFALYAIGLFFSILLFLKTHGLHSNWIEKFCTNHSGKASCSSVLQSKAGTIIGEITWSDIGVIYFLFMTTLALVFSFKGNEWAYIIPSCAAFPYTIFSIWYQGKIVHSWCKMCLIVQTVLVFAFILTLAFLITEDRHIALIDGIPITILGISITTGYFIAKRILKLFFHDKAISRQYKLLKMAQPECTLYVSEPTEAIAQYASVIYHPEASHKITVAFRFGCSACLRDMEKVIATIREKKKVAIELIFVSWHSHLKWDLPFILHFTKAYITNKEQFLNELDNYISDYPSHKDKYSEKTNDIPIEVKNRIVAHIQWSKTNQIERTPTYFLDNRKISPFYTFDDLVAIVTNL